MTLALIVGACVALLLLSRCGGCRRTSSETPKEVATETKNVERVTGNGVYHWRTVFDPTKEEWEMMKRHNVKKMCVRMFDVVYDEYTSDKDYDIVPVATTKFKQKPIEGVSIVSCVYITTEAMRHVFPEEAKCGFAELIVTRILNMMDYNELGEVKEIQYDCDWTESTRYTFFALCKKTKEILEQKGIAFGVTIRLHQLSQECPPAHYGVLMLYNTGGVKSPNTRNSILAYSDVKPYLRDCKYSLPLDFAYPAFSWNVWFRNNEFQALISEADVMNTKLYKNIGDNKYEVIEDHYCKGQELKKGDVLRNEKVNVNEVVKVKKATEKALKQSEYSVMLYHLSSKDIKNMTEDEINSIYKMD